MRRARRRRPARLPGRATAEHQPRGTRHRWRNHLAGTAAVDPGLGAASVVESEAVRLFLDRARVVEPDFALTERDSPSLVDICRRVDGLPLALELAAAWVDVLSVEQIAARLDDRFRLLATTRRQHAPRHQSLRETLEWSFQLLSPAEALLWTRLSVFAGGWTLEAAEAVCAGGSIAIEDVLQLLSQLVRKSLVVVDPTPAGPRYRLLETTRQYASDRLLQSGETPAVRDNHLAWSLELAHEGERQLMSEAQPEWLQRLELEHDNLRAALQWSLTSGATEAGLALVGALWRFWWMHGYLTEGREHLASLSRGDPPAATASQATALNAAGLLALWQGDFAPASALLDEAAAIATEIGDLRSLAFAQSFPGRVCRDQGDVETSLTYASRAVAAFRDLGQDWDLAFALHFLGLAQLATSVDAAERSFEESAARFRAVGDRWSVAMPLRGLGLVAYTRNNDQAAHYFFDQGVALFRERGDAWAVAMLVHDIGCVARRSGELHTAQACFQEALLVWRRLGNERGCALGLIGLGGVAAARGRARLAARLFGAAVAAFPTVGDVLEPTARSLYQPSLAAARRSAGSAKFDVWFAEGRSAPLAEVIAEALASESLAANDQQKGTPRSEVLSAREEEIAALIARGRTNRQIAADLVIAERTAEAHVEHIRNKLGFRSRAQIAAWAADRGIRRL